MAPIWAINSTAKAHSEWGTAAGEGSKAIEHQELLASYPEAAEAEQAAEALPEA
ncbi:MAG TPA: hypothetical protein VM848_04640 [Acidimicrobiia bacterium]|nr:hypothetical protein [Acidimicrobiia bacterium]